MKLKNIRDINEFLAAVNECRGAVWIESLDGDRFDLKSVFSQYLAIGKLIEDQREELELFATYPEDQARLVNFFFNHEEMV